MNTKKIFAITVYFLSLFAAMAQVPQAINYQGAARAADGKTLANKNIAVKISILQKTVDGTAEYIETHKATTNSLGLFTLMIGKGQVGMGTFNKIAWSTEAKFIKVEYDPAGGTNYMISGVSQILSVPYALEAGGLTLTDENENQWKVMVQPDGTLKTMPNYKTPAPTNLKATIGNALRINLDFAFNTLNEKGVEIYRSYGNQNNFSLIKTIPTGTRQFADSTLLDDTLTFYKLKGLSTYGSSDFSNVVSVKLPKYILPKPTIISANRTSGVAYNVYWDYKVYLQNFSVELWRSLDNGSNYQLANSYYNLGLPSSSEFVRDTIWDETVVMSTNLFYKVRIKFNNNANQKTYFSEFSNALSKPFPFEYTSCNSTNIMLVPISYYNLNNGNFSEAISTCNNLVRYGYSDWYLPSKNELDCVYANKNTFYNIDAYQKQWWSSTESGSSAYSKDFTTGASILELKTTSKSFFCVRK